MDPMTMAALAQVAVSLGSSLFGGDKGQNKMEKIPTMNPGQENLLKILTDFLGGQGGQGALGQLQGMLDPNSDIYKNFEKPYLNEFNEKTIPQLAEQYAGGGALSSSGFAQAMGGAGAGLQANLAGQKGQMMQNAIAQILGLIPGTLGKEPFTYTDTEKGTGYGSNFMQGLGNVGSNTWQDIFKGFGGM